MQLFSDLPGYNSARTDEIRAAFGFGDKVPATATGFRTWLGKDSNGAITEYTVELLSRSTARIYSPKATRPHRIMVHCRCGVAVPSGRISQHKCKGFN